MTFVKAQEGNLYSLQWNFAVEETGLKLGHSMVKQEFIDKAHGVCCGGQSVDGEFLQRNIKDKEGRF